MDIDKIKYVETVVQEENAHPDKMFPFQVIVLETGGLAHFKLCSFVLKCLI